jgi:hypothetical protein
MLVPGGIPASRHAVSFWYRTDRIDDLYQLLKKRQLDRASALLAGKVAEFPEIKFKQDIHDAFYGEREFAIVDLNGYELFFVQALEA